MDIRKAPKEVIYKEACEYYKRLCDLFQRGHEKQPPTLVLYDIADKRSVEVYPEIFSQDKMLNEFIKLMNQGKPVYKTEIHAIGINRSQTSIVRFYSDIAEEVTHAVIGAKEPVFFYDHLPKKIHHTSIETIVQGFSDAEKIVNADEFFPSIGENYLLQRISRLRYSPNRWDFLKKLSPVIKKEKDWEQQKEDLKYWVSELFIYLPQIAGDELVKQYNYDSEQLLKKHPDILTLTGIEIWQKYCFPILKDFDFDKILT
ncbi:hypothetical protein HY484_03725 [Candidatus Woesearchaeota archaeon]|nr:hypothetical protein [Candidatus Woesearchaeota archaeon]